jgi:RHS repeat-associated protein
MNHPAKRLIQLTQLSACLLIAGAGWAQTVTYGYDTQGRLSTATSNDGTVRTYVYESSSFPNALTGVKDEDNSRYSTWGYDTQGRATSTTEAVGAESTSLVYNANGTVTVTDALGAVRTFSFGRYGDRNLVTAISGSQCPTCREGLATTYDTMGFVASRTDYNGNITTYVYDDSRGLETSRTEASGTARARTITTQWHSTFRVPTLITEPNRTTAFTYDTNGNALTKTITDTTVSPNVSRTWTYTYDSFGHVLTVDGARTDVTDVTTYTYYSCTTGLECGQLHTVTDALGHVTTFNTYNASAQPLTITDPNGVVTTLSYDSRQRLSSRTTGGEQTAFAYWPTGLLKKVTLPDGSFLTYTYDAAHRLTGIDDAAGNHMGYTLDALGNRTAENLYDPSSALARTHTRVFNSLSQLWKDVTASGTTGQQTVFGYDSNGNRTTINAPLSRNTANTYDELNRLKQVTDANSGILQLAYDANDNLTSVTDPRSLQTTYTYSGFGDLKQQASPDTGTTANTFDSAGNLSTSQDARSKSGTYTYDARNRITQLAYSDQTFTYAYDSGTNGVGRLSAASDAAHSLGWSYDALGRVTSKSQTLGSITKTVGYGYTNGNLTSTTLPSGQVVTYAYTNGQITSVSVGATTVLNTVLYDPFGPARQWTWGNTTVAARTYDTDGKVSQIDSAGLNTYGYDDAFRVTGITDTATSANSWTYSYDLLDRLTSAANSSITQGFTYDADGNRLTQTGTASQTLSYPGTSNRLSSVSGSISRTNTFDAAGHIANDGTTTYTYNDAGRVISATTGSTTTNYVINVLGQRVKKSDGSTTTYFAYDEAGHLIGEYDGSGALVQELVWLDDIPVATLRPKSGGGVDVFYIHTDHLNTPRRITRPSDNAIVWRWDSDPFGTTAANENPGGLGTFNFNLRFPGQYFDQETGLNYNYFRDYDAQIERYVESDPIGLRGGINTYAYVNANPIALVDPRGLVHWDGAYNYTSGGPAKFGSGVAATGFTFVLKSKCVDGKKAIARVDALAGGLGTGVSFFGPLSIGASTVSFEDNLSSLNPNIFEGDFSYTNAGTNFGSVTSFALGGAIGDGSGLNASTSIIDISGGRGKSHLTWVRFQDCDCDTNR